jgi:hypothetical protein
LDVIKTADWVVDLGPKGGTGGDRIIATGTPEDVARTTGSHTGRYLVRMLRDVEKVGAMEADDAVVRNILCSWTDPVLDLHLQAVVWANLAPRLGRDLRGFLPKCRLKPWCLVRRPAAA